MITEDKFRKINEEVIESLNETFDKIKTKNKDNYIILIANGEYYSYLEEKSDYNPYVIDYRIDGYRDESRLKFLVEFMKNYYEFKNPIINDNEYRMSLELMIYTHIWESKPFLKKLYRVAQLSNKGNYEWKVEVPEMGKHNYIREKIRKTFETANLKISRVIKKGFHTSLRNAFAHSEYSFNTVNGNNHIELHNFKNQYIGELDRITFDEWSERFAYSVLLCYHFENINFERRESIITDFDTNIFKVKHPKKDGTLEEVEILYDTNSKSFLFKR